MAEPVRIVLLQCVVRPIWVVLDSQGRPVEMKTDEEQWAVHYGELDALRARVEAKEQDLTAAAQTTQRGGSDVKIGMVSNPEDGDR